MKVPRREPSRAEIRSQSPEAVLFERPLFCYAGATDANTSRSGCDDAATGIRLSLADQR